MYILTYSGVYKCNTIIMILMLLYLSLISVCASITNRRGSCCDAIEQNKYIPSQNETPSMCCNVTMTTLWPSLWMTGVGLPTHVNVIKLNTFLGSETWAGTGRTLWDQQHNTVQYAVRVSLKSTKCIDLDWAAVKSFQRTTMSKEQTWLANKTCQKNSSHYSHKELLAMCQPQQLACSPGTRLCDSSAQ